MSIAIQGTRKPPGLSTVAGRFHFKQLAMTQKEEKELQKWESAREYQKFADRHGFSTDTKKSIPDLVGLSKEDKKLFLATLKDKKP